HRSGREGPVAGAGLPRLFQADGMAGLTNEPAVRGQVLQPRVEIAEAHAEIRRAVHTYPVVAEDGHAGESVPTEPAGIVARAEEALLHQGRERRVHGVRPARGFRHATVTRTG